MFNVVCGVRGRLGMCELIEKSPMQKCLKTFVHDYRRRWTKLGKNGQMDTQNSQKTAN